MTCKEINNLLPAYLEDILSLEEKKLIESHLASCPLCKKAFADLKKTERLVKGLKEVEPPPFFEQRIMAQVREEAGQEKGILRKFFYPLRIKIPIQVMATVLVAVLAFYVYQKNEPEMKHLTPFPVPLKEIGKGRVTAESPQVPPAPSVVQPTRRLPAGEPLDKDRKEFAPSPFEIKGRSDQAAKLPAPKQEERPAPMKPEAPVMAAKEKEIPQAGAETVGRMQDRIAKQQVDKAIEPMLSEQKRSEKKADTGAAADEIRIMRSTPPQSRLKAAAVKKQSTIDLTIQVRDTSKAVREIEEGLSQVNAQIVERMHHQGSQILKIEMAALKVAPFLDRLQTIGRVSQDKNTLDLPDGKVTLSIRIVTIP